VYGVDVSVGPAFIWWQFAFGAAVAVIGATGLGHVSAAAFQGMRGLIAGRLALLALAGAATVVRSFRLA
jgi:hypothetical protein